MSRLGSQPRDTMIAKLAVAIATLTLAIAAIPGVAAESNQSDPGQQQCLVEDVGCYCSDPLHRSCGGLTGTRDCIASVGPTPGIQVGVVCSFQDVPIGA